jgi:hypothetical protein
MSVVRDTRVLSGLCGGVITRPEQSDRMWCFRMGVTVMTR